MFEQRANADLTSRLEQVSALVEASQEEVNETIKKKRKIGEKRLEMEAETTKKILETGLKINEKTFETSDKPLRTSLESSEKERKTLLMETIAQWQEVLDAALLVRKFETFNRTLQGVINHLILLSIWHNL